MKPIRLGEMIKKLESIEPKYEYRKDEYRDKIIHYDFPCQFPTFLQSYRGNYSELALGYTKSTDKLPTVEIFLNELKNALGQEFEGYKGGYYKMDKNSEIWVDEYGDYSGVAIVDVIDKGDFVLIVTAFIGHE